MSTSPQEPGSGPESDAALTSGDQQAQKPEQTQSESAGQYTDQDAEPPLSAPDGANGEGDESPLPPGTHGSARRPPADS